MHKFDKHYSNSIRNKNKIIKLKDGILKLGYVELTEDNIMKYLLDGRKYILTATNIYKLCYDMDIGYYGEVVYHSVGMLKRNVFKAVTPDFISNLLGSKTFED